MQIAYFLVDRQAQLQRVARDRVEAFWRGDCQARDLGFTLGNELRVISVLVSEDLEPLVCYFLRLELVEGVIAEDSKIEVFEAIARQHQRRYDNAAAQRQFQGWPADWKQQLAVALDVPAASLRKLGLGGPLPMAELWGIPLDKVLQYFEEAAGE